jgi:hypothetical protein
VFLGVSVGRIAGIGATFGRVVPYMYVPVGGIASASHSNHLDSMQQNTITSARGIIVRFLGSTELERPRVKLSDAAGIIKRSVTISYDGRGSLQTALAFLLDEGWPTAGARYVSTRPNQKGDTMIVLRAWSDRDHWYARGNR